MKKETDKVTAHWLWKALASFVGVVGLYVLFIFFQCVYLIFVEHMRVFFPLLAYPLCLIIGYLFLQTPFLVFRRHGPRARIQTSICSILAAVIIVVFVVPNLFVGDLNDFKDDFLNAVWNGKIETVERMLQDGANPNKRDSYGNNPMTLASYAGQTEVARLLLKYGADIQSNDGSMTPLHCAAYYGHIDTIGFLLSHGADVMATNRYGETAQEIANRQGFIEVAVMLARHKKQQVERPPADDIQKAAPEK